MRFVTIGHSEVCICCMYADYLSKRDSADCWGGVLLFCDMLITAILIDHDDVKWWVN